MTRILYLSLSALPSTQANTIQVMHTCAALAARGHDVTLVVKRREENGADRDELHDPYAHYGVPRTFRIVRKARPSRRGGDLAYSLGVARYVHAAVARGRVDVVYARHIPGAVVSAELGIPTVFEAHGLGHTRSEALLWRRLTQQETPVVAITRALADALEQRGRARAVHVVPDASDDLGLEASAHQTRARDAAFNVGYAGTLSRAKGLALLVDVARAMPHVRFRVAGALREGGPGARDDARDDARELIANAPRNFMHIGAIAPRDVGAFLRSCDVVVAPYPASGVQGARGGEDITRWMSPLKIFEAMSSRTPLVATDLPVLREVLRDGDNALLAGADDVAAWCRAIDRLRNAPEEARAIAARARAEWAAHYSYAARAAAIEGILGALVV